MGSSYGVKGVESGQGPNNTRLVKWFWDVPYFSSFSIPTVGDLGLSSPFYTRLSYGYVTFSLFMKFSLDFYYCHETLRPICGTVLKDGVGTVKIDTLQSVCGKLVVFEDEGVNTWSSLQWVESPTNTLGSISHVFNIPGYYLPSLTIDTKINSPGPLVSTFENQHYDR